MHMRVLRRACCALLFALGTHAAIAAPTDLPFLDAKPCFSVGYDEFMTRLGSRNGGDARKLALLQSRFPRSQYEHARQNFDCNAIQYESDGLTILGWMVAPKSARASARKFPVVIYNRGGNGSFGALKFLDLFSHVFPLADQGFLVLASQYRGVTEADPEKFGVDEFGGADVHDVRQLIALAKQVPGADPDNIFLLGVSRGVMEGYLAARHGNDIRAMAMVNGVVDLQADLEFRPEMEQVYRERMPGYAEHKEQLLRDRSALVWAEDLPKAPILLMHGTEDERVAPGNGPKMKQRLDALQHPNRLVMFQGADHFLDPAKVVAEAVAWFRANLH